MFLGSPLRGKNRANNHEIIRRLPVRVLTTREMVLTETNKPTKTDPKIVKKIAVFIFIQFLSMINGL